MGALAEDRAMRGDPITDEQYDRLWKVAVHLGTDAFKSECKKLADVLSLDANISERPNAAMGWRY